MIAFVLAVAVLVVSGHILLDIRMQISKCKDRSLQTALTQITHDKTSFVIWVHTVCKDYLNVLTLLSNSWIFFGFFSCLKHGFGYHNMTN